MKLESIALCVFAALAVSAPAAFSQETNLRNGVPSVTVNGVGKVSARPDLAEINVGVSSQADTASAALTANNTAMSQLMTTLKQAGIDEKDILTSNFSVNPVYEERSYGSMPVPPRPAKIVGYRVDNSVHVRVRKLADLGKLLDTLVRAGSNTMHGISFSVAQPEPLLDKARELAVADAKHKAELYTKAAGYRVGRPLFITESSGYTPVMGRTMAMAAPMAAEVPIAAGQQEMQVSVQVVYVIEGP